MDRSIFTHTDTFVRRHIGPDPADVRHMLDALGYDSLDALVNATVPESIRLGRPLALFTEALSDHVLPPFEQARTRLLLGSRLRRARRVKDAKVHLHAALTRFDSLGSELWAAHSRSDLRAAGDPAGGGPTTEPEVLAELTPRELQIVQSVAEGMTNRQIAAELFVSPRTISDHLYKLFPKLGISSRHQLRELRAVVTHVDVHGK